VSLDALGDIVPLSAGHDPSAFESGEKVLDDWLRRRALRNADIGASRSYVICPSGEARVVGYFALSMGQILNRDAAGAMRRNMPQTIPAVVLGRLAVDITWHRRGLGALLLHDAASRAVQAGRQVAARLLLVQAISPAAEAFYRHHGFVRLPLGTPSYALDLVKAAAVL
jgi:predicted N-acetyltransferase YhbS